MYDCCRPHSANHQCLHDIIPGSEVEVFTSFSLILTEEKATKEVKERKINKRTEIGDFPQNYHHLVKNAEPAQ